MVRDREADILIDPSKVHEIHHKGKYFDVLGIKAYKRRVTRNFPPTSRL